MSETIESPEAEVVSITDAPEASYNSMLKVFEAIFNGIDTERDERITPVWANRMISLYPQMTFKDLPAFHERYFNKLEELRNILRMEIEAAGDDIEVDSSEEDIENNSARFLNLLLQWQVTLQQWDLDWRVDSEDAVVEMAAASECFKFLFGQTGITQFFSDIEFTLSDEDQKMIGDAILEAREETGE